MRFNLVQKRIKPHSWGTPFKKGICYALLVSLVWTSSLAPQRSMAFPGSGGGNDCKNGAFGDGSHEKPSGLSDQEASSDPTALVTESQLWQQRQTHLHRQYLLEEIQKIGSFMGDAFFIKPLLYDHFFKPLFIDGFYVPLKEVAKSTRRNWQNKDTRWHYLIRQPLFKNGSTAFLSTWIGKAVARWSERGMMGGAGGILNELSVSTLGMPSFWHSMFFELLIPVNTDIVPRTEISRFRKISFKRKAMLSWLWPGMLFAGASGAVPLTYGVMTGTESAITYGMASIAFGFPAGLAYHSFRKWVNPLFQADSLRVEEGRLIRSPLFSRELIFDMELHAFQVLLFNLSTPGRNLLYLEENRSTQRNHQKAIEEFQASIEVEEEKSQGESNPRLIQKWQAEIERHQKSIEYLKNKEDKQFKKSNEAAERLNAKLNELSELYNDLYLISRDYEKTKNSDTETRQRLRERFRETEERAKGVFTELKLLRANADPKQSEAIHNALFSLMLNNLRDHELVNQLSSDSAFNRRFMEDLGKRSTIDDAFNHLIALRDQLASLANRIDQKQFQEGQVSSSEIAALKKEYDEKLKSVIELMHQTIDTANRNESALIDDFQRNLRVHHRSKEVRAFQLRFDDIRTEANHLGFSLPEINQLMGLKPEGTGVSQGATFASAAGKWIKSSLVAMALASAYFTVKQQLVGSLDGNPQDDDEKLLRSIAKRFYMAWSSSDVEVLRTITEEELEQGIEKAQALITKVIEDIPDRDENDFLLQQLELAISRHHFDQPREALSPRLKSGSLESTSLILSDNQKDAYPGANFDGFYGASAAQIIPAPVEDVIRVFQNRTRIDGLENKIASFKDVEFLQGNPQSSYDVRFRFNTFSDELKLWVTNHFEIFEHTDDSNVTHQIVFWRQKDQGSSTFKRGPQGLSQVAVHQNAGIIIISPLNDSESLASLYGFQWVNDELILTLMENASGNLLNPLNYIDQNQAKNYMQNLTRDNYSGFIRLLRDEFR